MLKHYLTPAFRFLNRNKLYTAINSLGLAISLAISFIILLYVINEFSFDHLHKNRKNVYRVNNYHVDAKLNQATTPHQLARILEEEFPQVEKAVSTGVVRGVKLKSFEEFLPVERAITTTSEVFDIFTIPLVSRPLSEDLLLDRNSIVLSRELANKLFKTGDPVGKVIEGNLHDSTVLFTVTGTFENIPQNSSFQADCFLNPYWNLVPYQRIMKTENLNDFWFINICITWVLLNDGSDLSTIDTQLREMENTHVKGPLKYNYSLQKLSDVHLKSDDIGFSAFQGNMKDLKLFSLIAFLIVFIASTNYIILSIAVSTGRTKEIGIRKTAGGAINRIRNQLLSESIGLSILVLPIALVIMVAIRPYSESLFDTELHVIPSNLGIYIVAYILITLLIGLTSGLYTSSYMARLKVIDILRNTIHSGKSRKYYRFLLTTVQLIIFCTFVSSTLLIRSQYQFAIKRDPGHYVENILFIDLGRNFKEYESFLNKVRSIAFVEMATGSMDVIPTDRSGSMMFQHLQNEEVKVRIEIFNADYQFLEIMGIPLAEGRYYSEEFGNDMDYSVILNETAVKKMGIENPMDQKIKHLNIVGVVKDFTLHSVQSEIQPLFIHLSNKFIYQLAITYQPGTLDNLIPLLKSEWDKTGQEAAFSYLTIEESIENLYASEKNLSTILALSSLLAIIIAAFGLIGLTLFVSKSRTNEIGIRKVFGSTEKEIVLSFLNMNFLSVITAGITSVPITLFFFNRWLENYTYKVEISWWVFIITGLIAAIVVLSTVLIQSLKASRINPVEALRYE